MYIDTNGGAESFRAAAYYTPSQMIMDEIRQLGANFDNNLRNGVTSRISKARESFNRFDFDGARRRMVAAQRKLSSMFMVDAIQTIDKMRSMQHAPSRMINYIMSEPTVREEYYANRCEGYGERYNDPFPNQIGEEDPIYRQVMNGVWQYSDDGSTYIVEYWHQEDDDLLEDISPEEQLDVVSTWDSLRCMLTKMDDDPTSPNNAKL